MSTSLVYLVDDDDAIRDALAALPPLEAVHSCVAMGASIGMAHGTRMSMDQMLSFAVKDRADFEAIKHRFDAKSPARNERFAGGCSPSAS